ncbi:uncharacterized protein LOC144640939 [Oculina patagonica]
MAQGSSETNVAVPLHNPVEWSPAELASWLNKQHPDLEPEASLLQENEISGKTLALVDRQCLKDIGIVSIGKQLAVLACIKELLSNTERESSQKPKSVQSPSKRMKVKITRKDKQEMRAEDKHLYHSKIKLIRKECLKRWPGNNKVYFRSNNTNSLILSEMVSSLEPLCTVKEIGFGQSAIRNHILQWVSEKNRKLNDGYDFEKSRTPAKRAISSDAVDLSESIDETDTEKPTSEDLGETCSVAVDDISDYSAQLVCAVFFKVATFRNLSVRKHLSPLAKELGIKHRGNSKYELAKKVATELVKREMVHVTASSNYKCLSRDEIIVKKGQELPLAEVSTSDLSSSGSTKSVDDTTADDSSSLSDFSDEQCNDNKK